MLGCAVCLRLLPPFHAHPVGLQDAVPCRRRRVDASVPAHLANELDHPLNGFGAAVAVPCTEDDHPDKCITHARSENSDSSHDLDGVIKQTVLSDYLCTVLLQLQIRQDPHRKGMPTLRGNQPYLHITHNKNKDYTRRACHPSRQ